MRQLLPTAIGRVVDEMSDAHAARGWTDQTIHASSLSCQGLWNVSHGDAAPTWHGHPVVGYHEEMTRRGEHHVYGCELIGHGIR